MHSKIERPLPQLGAKQRPVVGAALPLSQGDRIQHGKRRDVNQQNDNELGSIDSDWVTGE